MRKEGLAVFIYWAGNLKSGIPFRNTCSISLNCRLSLIINHHNLLRWCIIIVTATANSSSSSRCIVIVIEQSVGVYVLLWKPNNIFTVRDCIVKPSPSYTCSNRRVSQPSSTPKIKIKSNPPILKGRVSCWHVLRFIGFEVLLLRWQTWLMKCDFVNWIEGAQTCPTPCLGACVSEKTAPLRMVTGVMPAITSPTFKLEQRGMIYQDKGW